MRAWKHGTKQHRGGTPPNRCFPPVLCYYSCESVATAAAKAINHTTRRPLIHTTLWKHSLRHCPHLADHFRHHMRPAIPAPRNERCEVVRLHSLHQSAASWLAWFVGHQRKLGGTPTLSPALIAQRVAPKPPTSVFADIQPLTVASDGSPWRCPATSTSNECVWLPGHRRYFPNIRRSVSRISDYSQSISTPARFPCRLQGWPVVPHGPRRVKNSTQRRWDVS